ncbi:hypothetical protein CEXT_462151 [Caerostris extrusa]|uniref:Uncharacterized protein n=1 Tax=Caerostris extrusa TaxID=172846 RepID=A0AAV4P617_CAEEX|nr:hypothetical protein CEXT_462151 [Caerostris extrusa]
MSSAEFFFFPTTPSDDKRSSGSDLNSEKIKAVINDSGSLVPGPQRGACRRYLGGMEGGLTTGVCDARVFRSVNQSSEFRSTLVSLIILLEPFSQSYELWMLSTVKLSFGIWGGGSYYRLLSFLSHLLTA